MPARNVYENKDEATYTTSGGNPYPEPYEVQRVGINGPLLLQDFHHIDLLAHFDRERIPERVVHAKGSGALGKLKITHDLSDICSAAIFNKVGTEIPAVVRFSTVGGESGSPDTARDPRGFSVKLKTEEGVWDWVFNNTPIFFLRDPAKFPHFIHTQKRDPQTHLNHGDDPDMFWDYLSQNPEAVHQVMILFGDRGVPKGYRGINGYSGHTYKFINKAGEITYVQIHLQAEQVHGEFFTQAEAVEKAGQAPDYATKDLFDAIEKGDHPKWTAYIQQMTPKQAEEFRYNILDLTKIWPHKEFPLRPFGELVLDQNPSNYFADVEQAAFAPAHMPPGIEPSADPVMQSRLFSYTDTQRYRLGTNYVQLPINKGITEPANFQRDGLMAINNQGSRPNYKSSIQPLRYAPRNYTHPGQHEIFIGQAIADLSEVTELDFEQPRALWTKVFDQAARDRYIDNVTGHMSGVSVPEIKERMCAIFGAVDPELGAAVAKGVGLKKTPAPYQALPASKAYRFAPNIPGMGPPKVGNAVNGL